MRKDKTAMPYQSVISSQKTADAIWRTGVRPWSEYLKSAHGPLLNTTERLDPSDPLTPAYMRAGMSDIERYVTLRDSVVFGATIEVVKRGKMEDQDASTE